VNDRLGVRGFEIMGFRVTNEAGVNYTKQE